MLLKILAALGAACVLWLLLWLARGAMLTPVRVGKNADLSLVITVRGPCPELEETLDALLWLRRNGTLRAELLLRDMGMDAETAAVAELLARRGLIKLITEVEDERG